MLRVGPFCDPQVTMLANRRFVPFAFDLNSRGGIADADAKKVVTAAEPKLAGGAVPTPEVLFMTHDGKVLGKVSNYASEAQFLAAMQKVLEEHPEYNQPTAKEKAASTPLEKGRLAFELLDYTKAKKELAASKDDEAFYLLGRIARYSKNWGQVSQHLGKITSPQWKDDAAMEKAHMLMNQGEFAKALECIGTINSDSNRYSEACYFKGINQHHLGKPKEATATWKTLITRKEEHDGWVYRADWAYCQLKQGASNGFSTLGKRTSLLGRIGYMGRKNPDLVKPRK